MISFVYAEDAEVLVEAQFRIYGSCQTIASPDRLARLSIRWLSNSKMLSGELQCRWESSSRVDNFFHISQVGSFPARNMKTN